MDYMDIDQIEEVPDTPDRFITSSNNNGNNTGNRSNGSSSCRVIDKDYFHQRLGNEQREKGKSVAYHGNNRRLFTGTTLGNSSSSKNVVPTVENSHHDKGKSLSNPSSFVDLTERNRHDSVFGLNNAVKLGPRSDVGKGVPFGAQQRTENSSSSSASTPPKVNRHKRLVRDGRISPHNIAKSKQVAERHDTGGVINTVASDGPSCKIDVKSKVDIKDLVSEAKDSLRFKGKGVSHHPFVHENPKSSVIFKEATTAGKESEGWRSTHNTVRKVDPTSINGDQHILRGKSASSAVNDQMKNGKAHTDHRNGSTSSSFYNHFDDLEIDSIQHKERAQLTKRQREVVGSSNIRGRDVAYVNNADVASSSLNRDSSASRSTRNKNRRGAGSSDQVIAIDELFHGGGDHGSSSNADSTVMALQLEADEMLARELQEQLYNEEHSVGFGTDEMDSYHALTMAMQHDRSLHASGRPSSRSRSNASRSGSSSRAQAPTSTRLPRLRSQFPGRPRTISSTRGGSIFPPNMDVDMRMHILEALEAFNDMEMPRNLLQVGREFNENDYEMLLALDDNNHQHGGATHAQINNLPQSTVQAENLHECAICLETPNVGETIRHLPCFHKFHKDCIDEWLRRKTSCPVCKSSIT